MSNHTTQSKTRNETRRIKMVFELAKDLQDDEVICEHCHGTGLEIADNVYGIQGDTTYIGVRFPYKHQSLTFCKHCYNGIQRKCPACGSLRGRCDRVCSCGNSDAKQREERHKKDIERWENATKEPIAEAWEKYKALYIDNADQYIFDPDELEYFLEDYEADVSSLRIYGTEVERMKIDADSVIENACDGLHEDAGDNCDSDSLQRLLNEWCAKQAGTETYWPDYKFGFYISQEARKCRLTV
jgi:hypothetical protein